ncbi:hypothetical protein BDD12DRAFT_880701 [Trichophaea hybrida]|nr:hypothetical protein BDD12DRAFT_880701 [Trichophaea hybrida]
MAFVGPSTWLDEQEPTEVDTYDGLKDMLEIKFTPTIKSSTHIINKIQTIKYFPDKTVEELITEIDKIMGRTHLGKYAYQTLLMERVPLSIAKKLTDSDPEWNPDPILRRREDMDVEKSAKMHGKLADKYARLERELEEQRQLTNLNLEAQKRWANSDDAKKKDHKPIKEESKGSFRCWNCWELGHREVKILQKVSSSEPRGSAAESDDKCTCMYPGLDYSINGLTATVNNNEVDTKPAKETFIQRVSQELKQQGVYPGGGRPNARRGDPDTLFPKPDECGYLPGVWDPTEWLKSLKPPINLISLLKCSPTYRKSILEYLFPDPTIETEEGAPPVRQPSRRQVQSRTPPEEKGSEPEENSRSPVRRLRN